MAHKAPLCEISFSFIPMVEANQFACYFVHVGWVSLDELLSACICRQRVAGSFEGRDL